ncbi:MAG TPA: pentapeptide repeat-containing protein, partial [Flavisolibacter sp.]
TVSFKNCTLNFSSFYKRQVKKTIFKTCLLQEVDFTDADLSGSSFDHCDFSKALFENTNLGKVDFRTAYNFVIDPERNRLKKARFDRMGIAGLLQKYDIQIS